MLSWVIKESAEIHKVDLDNYSTVHVEPHLPYRLKPMTQVATASSADQVLPDSVSTRHSKWFMIVEARIRTNMMSA